jgi:hypothetical protein
VKNSDLHEGLLKQQPSTRAMIPQLACRALRKGHLAKRNSLWAGSSPSPRPRRTNAALDSIRTHPCRRKEDRPADRSGRDGLTDIIALLM